MRQLVHLEPFPLPEVNLREGSVICEALNTNLRTLVAMDPDVPADVDEVIEYCRWLIGHQKPLRNYGYWCTFADDGMPSDARSDFIKTPTCAVLATLLVIRRDFPVAARRLNEREGDGLPLESALRRTCRYFVQNGFVGHGYDRYRELIPWLELLAEVEAISYLRSERDTFKQFNRVLDNHEQALADMYLADISPRDNWSVPPRDQVLAGVRAFGLAFSELPRAPL